MWASGNGLKNGPGHNMGQFGEGSGPQKDTGNRKEHRHSVDSLGTRNHPPCLLSLQPEIPFSKFFVGFFTQVVTVIHPGKGEIFNGAFFLTV